MGQAPPGGQAGSPHHKGARTCFEVRRAGTRAEGTTEVLKTTLFSAKMKSEA